MPRAIIVMGVSGTGKSTIGRLLAERIGADFIDADDLHPEPNVAKMAAGHPLTDDDRWPWLRRVGAAAAAEVAAGRDVVVACSALRRRYRDALRDELGDHAVFVHLAGDPAVVADRLEDRTEHFMPSSLLASQFETLEPLEADESGVVVTIEDPPDEVVERVLALLRTSRREPCS